MIFIFAHSLTCMLEEKECELAFSKFGNLEFCSMIKKKSNLWNSISPRKKWRKWIKAS